LRLVAFLLLNAVCAQDAAAQGPPQVVDPAGLGQQPPQISIPAQEAAQNNDQAPVNAGDSTQVPTAVQPKPAEEALLIPPVQADNVVPPPEDVQPVVLESPVQEVVVDVPPQDAPVQPVPVIIPTRPGRPGYQPTRRPAYQPTRRPAYQPTRRPAYQPPRRPAYQPPRRPAYQPTRRPAYQPARPVARPVRRYRAATDDSNTLAAASSTVPSWGIALIVLGVLVFIALVVIQVQIVMLIRKRGSQRV